MVVEHATDIVLKSARIVGHQRRLVQKLKAEGVDTTEAEHLLAFFVTSHLMFERCLSKALKEQEEAAAREAENLAAG
jgi:hypothetical protein